MYAMRPPKIPSTLSTKVHENRASCADRCTYRTHPKAEPQPQPLKAMGTAVLEEAMCFGQLPVKLEHFT